MTTKLDQLSLFDDAQATTRLDAESRLEAYRNKAAQAGFRRCCLPAWANTQPAPVRAEVWQLLVTANPENKRIGKRARKVLS